jgi:leucyl-tRNA synthetase
VDYYVGGVEHAVLHLLYARFYTKFLFDIGVVDFEEPFKKLFNQGMVNKNGKKMAKSAGNGVSPDELLPRYGCDSLRLYELFIGPPEIDCEWDDSGIDGVYRFLNKLWRLVDENKIIAETQDAGNSELERLRHRMIHDITTRLENLSLNTVISKPWQSPAAVSTKKLWKHLPSCCLPSHLTLRKKFGNTPGIRKPFSHKLGPRMTRQS